jgi:hypothetical protein
VHHQGQQVLARSRFPRDQDRLAGGGDGLEVEKHVEHGLAAGQHRRESLRALQPPVEELVLQQVVLAVQLPELEGLAYAVDKAALLHCLDQVVEGPQLHALHGQGNLVPPRDHDRRDVRVGLADLRKKLGAGQVGHDQVQDDHLHLAAADGFQHLPAVGAGEHVGQAVGFQQGLPAIQDVLLVVHQQDAGWRLSSLAIPDTIAKPTRLVHGCGLGHFCEAFQPPRAGHGFTDSGSLTGKAAFPVMGGPVSVRQASWYGSCIPYCRTPAFTAGEIYPIAGGKDERDQSERTPDGHL